MVNNFDIRKTLLQYDNVMNKQRELIYNERREVLNGGSMRDNIMAMLKDVVETAVKAHVSDDRHKDDWDIKGLIKYVDDILGQRNSFTEEELSNLDVDVMTERIMEKATNLYAQREKEFPEEHIREIERVVMLRTVDMKWMEHIDAMDQLKHGIGLRAYKNMDPVQEYQIEGMNMFDEMIYHIKEDTVKMMFRVRAERKVERERVAEPTSTNMDDSVKKTPVRKDKKVGRNDPCPCGSGKKYKNCCGRNA